MAKVKIKEFTSELLGEFLEENELALYNVEFVKEGKDWFLRVYIEKPEGAAEEYVSTDDCELVSRYLSDRLDEEDPIEQNYYLEVSSPGLDRALIFDNDYVRFAGRLVDVSLYKAFEGAKSFQEAKLVGKEDDKLIIEIDTAIKKKTKPGQKTKAANDDENKWQRMEIPFEQVSKVKLAVIF